MRKIVKAMVLAVFYLLVLPFGGSAWLVYKILGSSLVFDMFAEMFSLVPGFPGKFARTCYYKQTLAESHLDLFVGFGSYFSKIETRVGRGVLIGGRTTIGLADIGDRTGIANHVSVLSGARHHNFDDHEAPMFETTVFSRLHIGSDVFVGDNSTVMADIGDRTIVGAGSTVVKEIPPYSVAVGNPAKVIKDRRRPRTGGS